jgi:4-diphosphocytidyl-2-C-methyl-D-erythritol kinase
MPQANEALAERACAKINLSLHVVGRRDDGYHLLESLVAFTEGGDLLHFEPGSDLTLDIRGPFAQGLEGGDGNLVVRAARALGIDTGRIVLEKHLPIASGIGGGSADAAATLRGLMRRAGLKLDDGALKALALRLGADVPVCLDQRACFMSGIGEVITPVPALPPVAILLVNPLVGVATADVFRALGLGIGPREGSEHPALPPRWRDGRDLAGFLAACRNDLEQPALAIAPVIGEVLSALQQQKGCLVARMSGSGATCFGLFDTLAEAEEAERAIRARSPGWWGMASRLR